MTRETRTMEKIEFRKKLRKELLYEAYDFHFDKGGTLKRIPAHIDADNERKCAYEYLAQKGLILLINKVGVFVDIGITANGIDVIENEPIN